MAAPLATPPAAPSASPLKEIGVNLIDNPGLWFEQVTRELILTLKIFLPNLIGGLALLAVGWLTAFLVRWVILRFGKGLDAILSVVHRLLGQEVSRPHWSITDLVGNISYWITLAYFVSAAGEQVGLVSFANWILQLLGYLPRVLISGFILFIGYLISNGIRKVLMSVAESNDVAHGFGIAHLASGLILAFALLLALAQLGLDVDVFANIIVLAAAAIFGGAALAFGIGAGDAVRNVMASHYVRKAYRPGQRVRIRAQEGEILELTDVAVILETENGEAWIPARHFLEHVAVVLEEESGNRA